MKDWPDLYLFVYPVPGPGINPIRFVSQICAVLTDLCVRNYDVILHGHQIHFGRLFGQPCGGNTFSKNAPNEKSANHFWFSLHLNEFYWLGVQVKWGLNPISMKPYWIPSNRLQVYKRLESGSDPNTQFKILWLVFFNPQKSIRVRWVRGCLS